MRLTRLNSNVAGTVQQLNVHTVGCVVIAAQALMEIVPDDTLEVDANINNRDIGLVSVGRTASVKVATLSVHVLWLPCRYVSSGATQDKKQGLVFKATVELPTNKMKIENKRINLIAGTCGNGGDQDRQAEGVGVLP